MSLPCPAAGCRILGHHRDNCQDADCRGCIPRTAAPGLQLCDYHMLRIAADATRAADLYGELEAVLATAERPGERTSGTPSHGTELNTRAAAMRTEIRHILVSWCKLVADERGIALPADHIDAIAAYLALHREWLAAHLGVAGECCDELASLAHRAFNVAYPSGARIFPVGPCPEPGCTATVRVVLRRVDALLPSELVCDAEEAHSWPASRWRELGRTINHRYLSTTEIAQRWRLPVGTVHRLASEHRWRRTEDGRRPVLYQSADVQATFAQRDLTSDLPRSII